jgi:hypothetical protein
MYDFEVEYRKCQADPAYFISTYLRTEEGEKVMLRTFQRTLLTLMKTKEWIPALERSPEKEGYYAVKYADGSEDQKPYRIRGSVSGWLSEKVVTHWK